MNNYRRALSYVEAKKQADGRYKLFYRGTRNNAEINGIPVSESFATAGEARSAFLAMWIKHHDEI